MGQVYRARDTQLDRDVAIKILPGAFASDPERLARFEREAKTLASLNHPHIAAIYGFERSGSTHALVMELVEGEDLSPRIARGALPTYAGSAPPDAAYVPGRTPQDRFERDIPGSPVSQGARVRCPAAPQPASSARRDAEPHPHRKDPRSRARTG